MEKKEGKDENSEKQRVKEKHLTENYEEERGKREIVRSKE